MYHLTYQYKLKLTSSQQQKYESWLETSRRVWNYALAERKDWFKSRSCQINTCSLKSEYIISADTPRPTYASQCKSLTQARKVNADLKAAHSQMLQQVLRRLEKAFVSMWETKHGFPRFKKQGRMRSLVFPQLGKNPVDGNKIKLPGIGQVKMRLSRQIPDNFTIKQAQVVKKASGWYVMLTLQLDVEVPSPQPHGEALGIDLGLTSFIATSSGELVTRPRFYVDLQRKLKLLQKRVSRKVKGSNHWKQAVAKVSKLYEKIANTRRDFHFKLAHRLCDQAGMIFAEDLDCKALAKSMLAKHCLDAGWGQFLNILEWVAQKRDVFFAKVDKNGTSQFCPACGTHTGKKDLSVRVHECGCGYLTNRDVAAAQIIMQRGLAAVGHTVKMLSEGKVVGLPMMKESHSF